MFAKSYDEYQSLILRCIGEKDFDDKLDKESRNKFLKNVLYALFYYGSIEQFVTLPKNLQFDELLFFIVNNIFCELMENEKFYHIEDGRYIFYIFSYVGIYTYIAFLFER